MFLFNSSDWLVQTPISNTMPHASYNVTWRLAKPQPDDVTVAKSDPIRGPDVKTTRVWLAGIN